VYNLKYTKRIISSVPRTNIPIIHSVADHLAQDISKKNDFPRSRRQHTLIRLDVPLRLRSAAFEFLSRSQPDLTNRLVTTFWLRRDRVTRRLKTSKPQGLTRHLVHTPTRRCLLFVLRCLPPPLSRLILPSFYLLPLFCPRTIVFSAGKIDGGWVAVSVITPSK